MYWRVKNLGPEHLVRQYGVHVGLVVSVLLNVILIATRPNPHPVSGALKANFEQFARQVTNQLLDSSYITYEKSTSALFSGELAPSVVTQLIKAELLPKSAEDVKAQVRSLTDQRQVSAVRIDSLNQGEPNPQGLIPIEVSGVVVIHSAQESGPSGPQPFKFKFLMGQNAKTQQPIVAAFQG